MSDQNHEDIKLAAEVRTTLGKKVRSLRKSGVLPINLNRLSGKGEALSVNLKEFALAFRKAGETGLLYLEVDKKSIPTLILDYQTHPITDTLIHVDMREVNLKKKTIVSVPVEFVGESPAVKTLNGVLTVQLDHIDVEALPADIPAHIEIDVSTIVDFESDIRVSQIPTNPAYTIVTEPEKVIISVVEHKEESTEADTGEVATPEILSEKPAEEGAEGEAANETTKEE